MDEKYFAIKIEAKWQKNWAETSAFESEIDDKRPKFYQLEMLPYPSGNLHMGHVRNYSVGDALAWYKRLKGFNVLHPIGWDSFGQPAEDAAVKRGVNPRKWTEENIETMRGQLKRLGLSYAWSREMYAHRPEFYKFDQWFFLKMLEMGLAYKKLTQVNWCENDQATLSNEQASGGLCWRCGNPVTKKDLEQWFLRTTAYAGQLIDDMAEIESGWPQNVLKRQRDWIGRSEGAYVDFAVKGTAGSIRAFTTRIDTIFGANAIVAAAEHPIIQANRDMFSPSVIEKIEEITAANLKPVDREVETEKDGIDTGLRAVNPFSGEELPVWVGNYVMMEYGTGAVMSVPAHDERDFEFAQKFGLPIKPVITPADGGDGGELPFTEYGIMVNSGKWSRMTSDEGKSAMAAHAEKEGFGEAAVTYRLRDWGISRQRFWGSPIPVVYCDTCGTVPEKYENLPVELPPNAPITGTGESPLAKVPEFVNTSCPKCGRPAKRETDTMDTFVDSSWYFFRYTDPCNAELPFSPEIAAYWTPVDQYIGGDDHAVMHLIYTRFWTKVMRDIGLVKFNEPVRRLLTQGMVVGETFFDDSTGKRVYYAPGSVANERDERGKIVAAKSAEGVALKHAVERMSKSKGNGVDPDEMVEIYGADAARIFVLFAAPVENELVWNEAGIEGAVRFLQRLWRFVSKWETAFARASSGEAFGCGNGIDGSANNAAGVRKLRQKTHQTIKRVTENFESLQFNTPIAALMELMNAVYEAGFDPETASDEEAEAIREAVRSLILMLTPFAPHTAEELYSVLAGNEDGISANGARFPEFDEVLARADEIEIAIQVNGKLRSRIYATPEANNSDLEKMALADEKVQDYLSRGSIAKVIVVPKRLVNIVVRE